jgi:hypothetical protein
MQPDTLFGKLDRREDVVHHFAQTACRPTTWQSRWQTSRRALHRCFYTLPSSTGWYALPLPISFTYAIVCGGMVARNYADRPPTCLPSMCPTSRAAKGRMPDADLSPRPSAD